MITEYVCPDRAKQGAVRIQCRRGRFVSGNRPPFLQGNVDSCHFSMFVCTMSNADDAYI